jgi:hypothetical protein
MIGAFPPTATQNMCSSEASCTVPRRPKAHCSLTRQRLGPATRTGFQDTQTCGPARGCGFRSAPGCASDERAAGSAEVRSCCERLGLVGVCGCSGGAGRAWAVVENMVMLRYLGSTASASRSFGARPSHDGRLRPIRPGAGTRRWLEERAKGANHAPRGQGRVASGA